MNLFEQFSSVLLRDASHKYAGCTSAVELFSSNYHVSPAAPSDSFGLSPIFWKFIVEQVVEVRSCPIRVDGVNIIFTQYIILISVFFLNIYITIIFLAVMFFSHSFLYLIQDL